ncbi:Hsp20/alpha crystallin family protein [Schinkia azotoformans]|uniref:Heat shock protein Hsp20 n=1 Tax=Schinkia azotoformans LMG 9581 TaxID=1131731 RepID=K6CV86_SCHAZ|nr:Hsp20/alpha crystallin family protein [Schinkia azotoformans]EKN64137.1 heat shock protein Hsp20 [Schinkia azotoformans LMG 9581]MEC1637136.1 Hsp20/alpha crystallin family protein [Schinkia azotoformans]MEC1719835.1 Hsp20/alpha crystallin family protein [Schinkia azotoformans]MEC1945418.1 Hsp20/alpha crystallin family protein [Schinkia azotoformans]MED4412597.1 Hsp20/alpha crystallin family protein [Schinkia azotoformans]
MATLHDLLPRFWNKRSQELEEFFDNPWPWSKMFDVDVKENEKTITIHADLPGFSKDEIELALDEYSLTIKASRTAEKEEKGEKYYKQERSYGKVERTIPLPAEVISDSSKAKYEDGVLTITLEKKNPSLPDRKHIPIE